jgi:hypothetical protein
MSAAVTGRPTLSRKAVAALLFAVAALALAPFALLPAVAAGGLALLLAIFALRAIGHTDGRLRGGGWACLALVGGFLGLVVGLLVPAVRNVRRAAQSTTVV